jgi:hypothetical protein
MLAEKLNTHSEGKASGFARISPSLGFLGAPRSLWVLFGDTESALALRHAASIGIRPACPSKPFHLCSRPTSTSLTWRRLRTTAAKGITIGWVFEEVRNAAS